MTTKAYLHLLPPEEGRRYASFYVYLPASDAAGCYVQYRFQYEENPPSPTLGFAEGANDPSNRAFYRIREAYVGYLEGTCFTPAFRALQGGEIGFAFREEGAGDFVGGFHGDEVLIDVSLAADGEEVALSTPTFRAFSVLEFFEDSHMFRCNTPEDCLILHRQHYRIQGQTVALSQSVEWLADARPLQAAYMPMLTVQRLDPAHPERILTDTVEFYGTDGRLLTTFDTRAYGVGEAGRYADSVCLDTPAVAVRVMGSESGFVAEAGYTVVNGSIPKEQIKSFGGLIVLPVFFTDAMTSSLPLHLSLMALAAFSSKIFSLITSSSSFFRWTLKYFSFVK